MRIIISLLSLMLLSCGQTDREKAIKGIQDQYIKASSGSDAPLTIFDVNVTSIENVGEGRIDTLHRTFEAYAISTYSDLRDSYAKMGRESTDSDGAYYFKEETSYQDSLSRHIKLDSVYRARIQYRKNDPALYYLTTAYIKKTSGKEVSIDTLKVVLDKDFKYIKSFEIL